MDSTPEECFEALALPHGTVARLAKEACSHTNVRFRRETLTALNRATALFITYLTDAALEHAEQKKRVTVLREDVRHGLATTAFDDDQSMKEAA